MLAARIDRLPQEDRHLLQVASVIGKDVPLALLQAVADLPEEALRRGLDHLQAAEFVYEAGLSGDQEYSFKHALTHEVTYGSLVHEDRRALHARIVQALERLHADRLDEYVDALAHHALRGEVWERAVGFLTRAAAAVSRIAYPDAAAYYEQALEALRRLPEDRERSEQAFDLSFELARCLYSTGHFDRAMAAYRDAQRLAVALGDEHRVARVFTGLAYLLGSEADHHGSIEAGERALVLAARVADPALQIWTSVGMSREYFAVGDYRRGIERARAALDALESTPSGTQFRNLSPPVGCRTWLALCLASLGQFAESVRWAEEATELADRAEGPLAQVWANYTLGRIHCIRGHFTLAHTFLERAASLLERGRFPIYAGGDVAPWAKRATSTIPIVATVSNDPVDAGLVASLARPGGNVTGLTFLLSDLAAKRVEILREIMPRLSAVGVLWNPDHRDLDFKESQAAGAKLGLRVVSLEARRPAEIDAALKTGLRERIDALIVVSSRLMVRERARILDFATGQRLPMATGWGDWVERGALLTYGPNIDEIVRRSARHVDRILRGARPADLPMEQPTRFELVVNLKVAQALGLTAPPSLLARADRVIQ
jgi:ABC-type uncharacterized transport system substrate-binding protein/tetratricopeptide (TPR) repeat protein